MASAEARSSRVVVPQPLGAGRRFVARLIYLLIRALTVTLRMRLSKDSRPVAGTMVKPAVFCTWHNRLAVAIPSYERWVISRQPERRLAAMVSASRDGALLARILELFDVEPVRGSSSRRGPQALLELKTCAERRLDVALTPDGPRGPRYVVQEGVIAAAQLTGLPIVPFSYHAAWKLTLGSWDRFQVPLPFSRLEATFGEPIEVPADATDAQREALRKHLEDVLRAITVD